jgi:DNA polymerase III epsilon subunit-like protein
VKNGAEPFSTGLAGLRGRVACVDLETTGGAAASHRVIEVGIVLLEGGVVV